MNTLNGSTVHLQDEELVRLLDGEFEGGSRPVWDEHLSGCLPCAERFAELEQASAWLHENVATLEGGIEIDELARARALSNVRRAAQPLLRQAGSRGFGWARAAAVMGFLVVGGMTVQPVRAWVFDGVERLVRWTEAPAPAAVAIAPPTAGAMVAFRPTARAFSVEIDHPQASGALSIRRVERSGATAQVRDAGDESFSVLPAALLVENTPESNASYAIELPAEIVQWVQVSVAGSVVLERTLTGVTEPIILDLAAGSPR